MIPKKPDREFWTSAEAGTWKQFLGTDIGKKVLRYIAEEKPPLLSKGDINEILIRSGEVKAYDRILSMLLVDMIGADDLEMLIEGEHQGETYQPLEDDSKWEGPKLNNPEENTNG